MWVILHRYKGANAPIRILGERFYVELEEAVTEAKKQAPAYLQTTFFIAKVTEEFTASINVERKIFV